MRRSILDLGMVAAHIFFLFCICIHVASLISMSVHLFSLVFLFFLFPSFFSLCRTYSHLGVSSMIYDIGL